MDTPILRLMIQGKIAEGRLPHDSMPRMWGGPGDGHTCDGCGDSVTKAQMEMEGLDTSGGRIRFHVACFHVWDVERQIWRRTAVPRAPAPVTSGSRPS